MLKSVTYISTSRIGGDESTAVQEVNNLLTGAREYNLKASISGVLLFTAHTFLQVLEGPAAEVGALFERIQRDRRHTNVLVLDYRTLETRAFPNWSMAFVKLDEPPRFVTEAQSATTDHHKLIADLQKLVLRNDS
jgi:hypothetical protein